jgi:hypothetical protein
LGAGAAGAPFKIALTAWLLMAGLTMHWAGVIVVDDSQPWPFGKWMPNVFGDPQH